MHQPGAALDAAAGEEAAAPLVAFVESDDPAVPQAVPSRLRPPRTTAPVTARRHLPVLSFTAAPSLQPEAAARDPITIIAVADLGASPPHQVFFTARGLPVRSTHSGARLETQASLQNPTGAAARPPSTTYRLCGEKRKGPPVGGPFLD